MSDMITFKFKCSALAGFLTMFISIFMDWYHVVVYSKDGGKINSYTLTLFAGWVLDSSERVTIFSGPNIESMNAENAFNLTMTVPILLPIVFCSCIVVSLIVILVRPMKVSKKLRQSDYICSVILLSTVLLNIGFVLLVPIWYFINEDLFFPGLMILLEVNNYGFFVGIGYLLQLFAFIFVFPYCWTYYKIVKLKTQQSIQELEESESPLNKLEKIVNEGGA